MLLSTFAIFIAFSCEKQEIAATSSLIIGKWLPTYEYQTLNADGKWTNWTTMSTFVALPTYEFTSKGRFLWNGQITENCCMPGSIYKVEGNLISFDYEKAPDCSMVKCAYSSEKIIETLDEKTLVLIENSGRLKYKYTRSDQK